MRAFLATVEQTVEHLARGKPRVRYAGAKRFWRGASLHVHMEKLPDAKTREALREHWSKVLAKIAKD